MLNFAFAITAKDLKITFAGSAGLCQAVLLGLLLIFIFSLSTPPGEQTTPQAAAAIFWLGSAFCQILIFNHLYALEEQNEARQSLSMAPAPVQGIWLGKMLAGLVLLLLAQLIFFPVAIIFLGQNFKGPIWPFLGAMIGVDLGMTALGSLLGAVGQGQSGRESLLSIVLFPLMLPILLAAISLTALTFGSLPNADPETWLGLAGAFDAIFIAAGLGLFSFLYRSEE